MTVRTLEYIEARSKELTRAATERIKLIDELLGLIDDTSSRVVTLPRQGALLTVLHDARRNLVSLRDGAESVINDAAELRGRAQGTEGRAT